MKYLLLISSFMYLISMTPTKKKKIIFFGDSITQLGVQPDGYIDLLQRKIDQKGLKDQFELIGAGIGGNKVYDLYLRLEEDVLSQKPDIVIIYVGINDVWHKLSGTGTDLDKYEKFYHALISKIEAAGAQVMVCTPTVIGELKNNNNPQDKDLRAYAEAVRKIALAKNCSLIDLQKTFKNYLESNNSGNKEKGILTTDRVHLNKKGNELVADAIFAKISE